MQARSTVERSSGPIRVFYSYAHEDEKLRDRLAQSLGFLRRSHDLAEWHDRKIGPGDNWKGEIDDNLEKAHLILLLVSPAFADSDYCWDVETGQALRRHRRGEARAVPVILRPVEGWHNSPLGELQAVPKDGKAITTWRPRDKGYRSAAEGIKRILGELAGPTPHTEVDQASAKLALGCSLTAAERADLAIKLRKLSGDLALVLDQDRDDDRAYTVRASEDALKAVAALVANGGLASMLGCEVRGMEPLGAVIRLETRQTEDAIQSSITYLPSVFGPDAKMPPLVTGIAFKPDSWLQPGFKIGYGPTDPAPDEQEQLSLQGRLGRYLNTFLVVDPTNHHVTLSPLKDFSGLPGPLQRTELGRDLLAQDVALKHYTSCLLYPRSETGKEFWRRLDDTPSEGIEAYLRVWITPDGATIGERMDDGLAHVDVSQLRLKVHSADDLDEAAAAQLAAARHEEPRAQEILDAFREIVLPEIQAEVSSGSTFGILRQIFSIMVIATWYRRRPEFASALRKGRLLDTNDVERFNLAVAGDEVDELHQRYVEMFQDGVWRYVQSEFDSDSGLISQRLMVAGGVDLRALGRLDKFPHDGAGPE